MNRIFRKILQDKKRLVFIFALSIILASFIKAIIKDDDQYVDQREIKNYKDNYFNTTPRQRINEKIIVLYRDDGIVEIKTTLDAKGNETKQEERLIYKPQENQRIMRDGSFLRYGDHVLNGDILEKNYSTQGDVVVEESKILQNGEIKNQKRILDRSEYNDLPLSQIKDLKEADEEVFEFDGKKYIKKTYLDKDGNKYYEIFDENGNKLKDGYKISSKMIIGNNGEKIQEKSIIVQNGEIIEKISNVRNVQEGDISKIDRNGDHNLIKNINNNITADNEREILRLKNNRMKNAKSKIIFPKKNMRVKLQELRNQENNYSNLFQDEIFKSQKVIPSFPTDLRRVLTADKIIPAVLRTPINTQIPTKKILAVVESNVYATQGRKILIPEGSSVIGNLQPISNANDNRVNIVWKRILTPQGININLNAELNDEVGNSGLQGRIDNRWQDRYGMAFLTSFLNATAQFSVPLENQRVVAMANTFSGEMSQVFTQLIREGIKILPTIKIDQGTRINISPVEDIWFRSGKDGEIDIIHRSQLNKET